MQKNVTEYIKAAPENRKAALTKFRQVCNEILAGYEEGWLMLGLLIKKTRH